mgnify:CR=1 FL=1
MADRRRILTSTASIASSGLVALIPLGRVPAGARWGVGAALSLVPAGIVAALVERRRRGRAPVDRLGAAAAAGVAVGALSLASWEASVRIDRAVERALVARRVRRPRIAMAAGSAALAAVVEVLDAVVSPRARR